jgi:hypothetical protein
VRGRRGKLEGLGVTETLREFGARDGGVSIDESGQTLAHKASRRRTVARTPDDDGLVSSGARRQHSNAHAPFRRCALCRAHMSAST